MGFFQRKILELGQSNPQAVQNVQDSMMNLYSTSINKGVESDGYQPLIIVLTLVIGDYELRQQFPKGYWINWTFDTVNNFFTTFVQFDFDKSQELAELFMAVENDLYGSITSRGVNFNELERLVRANPAAEQYL
ncbi:MAG: hypothetical protein ACRCXZ_10410 [Patescibacteria group bacterium]